MPQAVVTDPPRCALCEGVRARRDMFGDLAVPGGVANRSFVVDWGAWCRAMDGNRLALLPQHTRYGLMLIAR